MIGDGGITIIFQSLISSVLRVFLCSLFLYLFVCVYIWKDLHFIEYNKKNMFYTVTLIIGYPLLLVDLI